MDMQDLDVSIDDPIEHLVGKAAKRDDANVGPSFDCSGTPRPSAMHATIARIRASTGSAAAGRFDLLTRMAHHFGALLGVDTMNTSIMDAADLMQRSLTTGSRREVTPAHVDAVFASID